MMPLFASVLLLDRKACRSLKVTDTYSLHRIVYSLFEDVRDEQQKRQGISSGILWADKGGDALGRQILMLSHRQPAACIEGGLGDVISKPLPADFLHHLSYRFSVMTNPVRCDSKSRKMIPIKGPEAIAEWFSLRAEARWGFTVSRPQLQIDAVRVNTFCAKQPVTLQQAAISGYLTVTDRDAFTHSVTHGIGRARSFGCGLLQIVPVLDSPFAC